MKMTLSSATPPPAPAAPATARCGPRATNIHFHGTNIAPVCGQDEVVHTLVQPGQSFDYNVQIPAERAARPLLVPSPSARLQRRPGAGRSHRRADRRRPAECRSSPWRVLPERTFVIRDQVLPASEANDANIPAWDISINYVPVTYPAYTPAIIQTNPGQQELWRVANTAADTILNLEYIVNGTAQPMQVCAIDGYPHRLGSSGQQSESETSILLGAGRRAEFVVTTPNVGDQAQLMTQYWNTGPDGDFDPTRPIANIVSQTGVEDSAAPGSSVRQATAVASHAGQRSHAFAALASAHAR